ncbi:hypothetical protein COU91_01740 [Candidatus Saccharibacteria bacterium CG10_big_fil_rev_8_21_14_0_10_47_8]|nr:MAG: hypothetical protein COU91_01740 [Candidatus Saccharibacteria bacterium CG10_big_fil_rev_8_21_14_0_10_47_8]
MKKSVIGLVIVVVIVAVGAFVLTRDSDKDKNTNSNNSTSSDAPPQSNTPPPAGSDQNAAATIAYSDSGFSPSKITVKSGATVTIKNTSSNELQFNSDPHPIHTDNEELNVGAVASGQSQTFTASTKGTFGYHNHLNPSDKGTIVVE